MISANRFRIAMLPLLLFAALFPLLSLDSAARLLAGAAAQEMGNLALLLFSELTRALRGVIGLMLVAYLLGRLVDRRHARALSLCLGFGMIAYEMGLSGDSYAGPFQEWLVRALLGLGVTRTQLAIVFGYPDWALWPALAGLIRFSVLFPEPLTAEAVERSGAQDRAGLMRRVPGAGVDVGGYFRDIAQKALARGWLEPKMVWFACLCGTASSVLWRGQPLKALLWFPFLFGVALSVTCLRASYTSGDKDARIRLLWIARGSVAAVACVLLAGIAGLNDNAAAAVVVFVLMTMAPGFLLGGLVVALLQRSRSENVVPVA